MQATARYHQHVRRIFVVPSILQPVRRIGIMVGGTALGLGGLGLLLSHFLAQLAQSSWWMAVSGGLFLAGGMALLNWTVAFLPLDGSAHEAVRWERLAQNLQRAAREK